MNNAAPNLRDPDLLQAGAALQRAARSAQELAQKTATPCYIWQNGKIENIGAEAMTVAPAPGMPDRDGRP